MKRMIGLLALLAAGFPALGEPQGKADDAKAPVELISRMFRYEPEMVEILGKHSTFQRVLTQLGVDWPAGSTVQVWQAEGLLAIVNTPSNLFLIQEILDESSQRRRYQVELEMQFVAFDLAVVEKLAIKGDISAGSLTELWEAGKGRLLACPRVITRSGNEATVRGVQELIYPTEFHDCGAGGDTNQIVSGSEKVVPGIFESREVGAIFSVIPEVSPEGRLVDLNLRPEWVDLSNWVDYGAEGDSTNRMPMKQPIFHRVAVETQISLVPGTRVLLGGGVPGKDEGTLIYTFITCRLVNAEGKALKTLYFMREPKVGDWSP